MTIRRTVWQPDTHPGVEIEYEWDDAVPAADRVHTPVVSRVKGQVQANPVSHFAKVLGENQRKNHAISEAEAIGIDPATINWAMDKNGNVTLSGDGLTAQHKAQLSARLSARFGSAAKLA